MYSTVYNNGVALRSSEGRGGERRSDKASRVDTLKYTINAMRCGELSGDKQSGAEARRYDTFNNRLNAMRCTVT